MQFLDVAIAAKMLTPGACADVDNAKKHAGSLLAATAAATAAAASAPSDAGSAPQAL